MAKGPSKKLDYPRQLRGRTNLSHADYRLLMTVVSYTDGNLRNAYPGTRRLADDLGMSGTRWVERGLARLIALGYLEVTTPGGSILGAGRRATHYKATLPDAPTLPIDPPDPRSP